MGINQHNTSKMNEREREREGGREVERHHPIDAISSLECICLFIDPFVVFTDTMMRPSDDQAASILLLGFLQALKASHSNVRLAVVRSSNKLIPVLFSFSFLLFSNSFWRVWYEVNLTMIALGFLADPCCCWSTRRWTRWVLSISSRRKLTPRWRFATSQTTSFVFSLSFSGIPKRRIEFLLEYCSWSFSCLSNLVFFFTGLLFLFQTCKVTFNVVNFV